MEKIFIGHGDIMDETVGLLLPTRGRYEALQNTLVSLGNTRRADLLDVIIVVDNDLTSHNIAQNFYGANFFAKYTVYFSEERLYPVSAFIRALNLCSSNIFIWMNDENSYNPMWLTNALVKFHQEFPDGIGLLSLYKKKKAGLGISSMDFIEFNDGEWFHDGYKVYYPDDELTCRAILLGRYSFSFDSGVYHDIEITKTIPIIPAEEKLKQKKVDRGLFYKRSEINFGLASERLYPWKGFREVNFPLLLSNEN